MKQLLKYRLEIFIVLLQLIEPISIVGLFLGCIYIFYKIAFVREIDLVSIFILLLPSIAFGYDIVKPDLNNNEFNNSWIKIYFPSTTLVYIIGSAAISIPFCAALAVPIRLILFFKKNNHTFLVLFWFGSLAISIIGLLLAIYNNQVSSGGLTVGLRIVLSLGVLLFPLSINLKNTEKQINLIVKISLILFVLGFLNGFWKFIVFSFPSYLIFSEKSKHWKAIGFLSLFIILYFNFSFTLLLTSICSLIFLLFYNNKEVYSYLTNYKLSRFFLFFSPIILMLLFVTYDYFFADNGIFIHSERFNSKLFYDRVPIWTFTLDLIINSNVFIVQAARDIVVIDYTKIGEDIWGIGAHNIYLEMARHLGLLTTIILTTIIYKIFIKAIVNTKVNRKINKFILSLFSVYLVWGLTGNALIYDGVGFFFWLIIGQLYQYSLNNTEVKYNPHIYIEKLKYN